jgi:hypothetical protein
MIPPQSRFSDGRYGPSPRNRTTSFALALAITLALFATLVAMGTYEGEPGGTGGHLVAMTIAGEHQQAKPQAAAKKAATQTTATATAATRVAVTPPIILPSKNTYELPPGFIQMNHADMASSNIGNMKSAPGASGSGPAQQASGGGSGEGEGPGGARLYNAEWYREPTDAELAGYMPRNRPPGAWALIACKTIDHYHVEDCRELGESPPGSGLSRALRQAAWQFLVRPPRTDGKPMIGAWVRIRFDFRKPKAAGDGDGGAG